MHPVRIFFDQWIDDDWFRAAYCSSSYRTYGQRRSFIASAAHDHEFEFDILEREHLRRQFDKAFGIEPNPNDGTYAKYAAHPDHPAFSDLTTESSMDRNLAALLRQDAKTIQVNFAHTGKHHTYVTHLNVQVGDSVVVDADGEVKIAQVRHVDNEVKIEPNAPIEYKWVIDTVDMAAHEANKKRNDDIVAEAAVIVRENMRRSFAQQVLGFASEDQKARLLALTGNAS